MQPLQAARELYDQLILWRRDFHIHPELGLEEFQSARRVAQVLKSLGYTVREGVAKTGVVAILENGPGPVVMSRADMDALPVQEENDVPYASQIPGKMHACGHDAHMAIGLGVATLMAQHRDAWRGTLKLVFQPGEEGANGADLMIKDGVLENPRPDAVLAVHVWNFMPYGFISAAPGPTMAGSESWQVVVAGKGGHGAVPESTIDPIVTSAMIITALQTIVSRNVSARDTAVVTVGMIKSGDAFNVIPSQAELRGTIRTYDPKVREDVLRRFREVVEGTAQMMGAQASITMFPMTPALINDEKVTQVVRDAVVKLWGPTALGAAVRTMGSEDAAFYLREVPGCYIFVGSGPADYADRPHHSPHFDIDERVLIDGVAVLVASLCRLLAPGAE